MVAPAHGLRGDVTPAQPSTRGYKNSWPIQEAVYPQGFSYNTLILLKECEYIQPILLLRHCLEVGTNCCSAWCWCASPVSSLRSPASLYSRHLPTLSYRFSCHHRPSEPPFESTCKPIPACVDSFRVSSRSIRLQMLPDRYVRLPQPDAAR